MPKKQKELHVLSLRSQLWILLIGAYWMSTSWVPVDDKEAKPETAPDRIVTRTFFAKSQNAILISALHEATDAPFEMKLKEHPSPLRLDITFTGPEYLADELEELFQLMNHFDLDVEREYGARLRQGIQVTREEIFKEMLNPYLANRL